MKTKAFFKALAVTTKRFTSNKKLAKSYISLFLVLLLLTTTTFAWFIRENTANLRSGDLEFQSASSLRINKDKYSANKITIPAFTLDEASSTDGRNIYFPLGESFDNDNDPKNKQFREANKGDENVRYVYKDFQLRGTSGNTPVYIKSYEIKIEEADTPHDSDVNAIYHDQLTVGYDGQGRPSTQTIPKDNCPIRLAFIADSAVNPVVIDPSAQVIDYVDNTPYAVSLVDENGVPTTQNTFPDPDHGIPGSNWDSFQSYYYGNKPLFVIPGGQILDVTLVIWLEGTMNNCDKYIGKKISVDIDIESNFAEMDTITFYDDSQPDNNQGQAHWVSNDNPIVACSYEDPFSDETPKRWKTVIMTKTADYTWQAKIPKKAVSEISFYRLSRTNDSTQGTIYNAWHTTSKIETWITASNIPNNWYTSGSMDLQTTRAVWDSSTNTYNNALVYTAVHGNGYSVTDTTEQRLAPCVGYWNYSGGSGSGGSVTPTESGGSGGGSASTYSVAVIVDAKGWVGGNVAGGSRLHFTTSSGGDYAYTTSTNTTHFEQTFTLNNGDEITGFYLLHTGGGKTNLTVNSIFKVTRNVNVVYTQQNNDTLTPNLTS